MYRTKLTPEAKKFLKRYRKDVKKANPEQELKIGEHVEQEHNKTIKRIAEDAKNKQLKPLSEYTKMIAKDHLQEISDYYTRLTAMEKEAETKKSKEFAQEPAVSERVRHVIERRNAQKVNKYNPIAKSYDFRDVTVAIDPQQQLSAETTTCPHLLKKLKESTDSPLAMGESVYKIQLDKGTLTLSPMAPGLFNGFFSDKDGQVVEKFDDSTIELIGKNLQLKKWYSPVTPDEYQNGVLSKPTSQDMYKETAAGASREIEASNPVVESEPIEAQPEVKIEEAPASVHIKYGDFELRIKKSIHDFVKDFKAAKNLNKSLIKKSISAWRRNSNVLNLASDIAAAEELFRNWDQHKEGFYQIVEVLKKSNHE